MQVMQREKKLQGVSSFYTINQKKPSSLVFLSDTIHHVHIYLTKKKEKKKHQTI